ncbi:MAG: hypothetical protein L6R43_01545 [Planctomycetes bacterium]|nr:hypothetical protein [Planctomycetota bacterium]
MTNNPALPTPVERPEACPKFDTRDLAARSWRLFVRPPLGELGVGVEVTAEDHSHARRRGQAALPAPAFQRLRHLAAEEAKGSVRPGLSGLPPLQVGGDHQGIEPVGQPVHGAAEDGEVALDGRPTPSGVQVPDPVPRLHLDA